MQLPDVLMRVDGMGRGRLGLYLHAEVKHKKVIVFPRGTVSTAGRGWHPLGHAPQRQEGQCSGIAGTFFIGRGREMCVPEIWEQM